MKEFKTTAPITGAYESPKCDILDIKSEGILCSSLEQLGEGDPLAW